MGILFREKNRSGVILGDGKVGMAAADIKRRSELKAKLKAFKNCEKQALYI